jgi:hypothetical protein
MANEINTNNSLNHRRNNTHGRRAEQIHLGDGSHDAIETSLQVVEEDGGAKKEGQAVAVAVAGKDGRTCLGRIKSLGSGDSWRGMIMTTRRKVLKYIKFIGPGFMVSVAYIDPGRRDSRLSHINPSSRTNILTRKLRDRCSRRSLVPIPPPFHDPALKHLRHLPAIALRQARNRDWHESG